MNKKFFNYFLILLLIIVSIPEIKIAKADSNIKICIIGDSRCVGMGTIVEGSKTTGGSAGSTEFIYENTASGVKCIAKGSQNYNWVTQDAQWKQIEALDKSVIIVYAMGINGCNSSKEIETAEKIADLGFKVYYANVLPVNDSLASSNNYSIKDSDIINFNSSISGSSKYTVIDGYSKIKCTSDNSADGIHHDGD